MLEVLNHLASLSRFAVHRQQREQQDASVLRELSAHRLELPRGLELEWLGTAGYRLAYQGVAIYIDPYFSRVTLGQVLRRERALPDEERLQRYLAKSRDRVAGILLGHCHFDHAIDAPAIARHTHAQVYGSRSAARLMALHGLAAQAIEVEPHRAYELGPFTVRFVPSQHSRLVMGYGVPYDGELTCEHLDGLCPSAYRCGQVWGLQIEVAGVRVYHQGSANLIDDQIRVRKVDLFLAGIAGRRFTPDYWARILGRLQPGVVVANHFDDFFRPLEAPLGFSLNVNLAALPEEIRRVSADFTLAALQPLQPVRG